MRIDAQRRRFVLTAAFVIGFVIAALSQRVVPRIAANHLRASLARTATGVHVRVAATPGARLLFHHADSVSVHISEERGGRGHIGDLIARTKATDRLDARVDTVISHGIEMHQVVLHKHGPQLNAAATILPPRLAHLPLGLSVQPVTGSTSVGFHVTVHGAELTLALEASDGRIVLSPEATLHLGGLHFDNVHIGGPLQIVVFADHRVRIEGISSRLTSGGALKLSAHGRLI